MFILLIALSSCQIAINSFSIPVASKYIVSTAAESKRSSVLDLSLSDHDNEKEDTASTSTKYNRRRALLSQALLAAPLTIATVPSYAASEKPPPIIPLKTTAKRLRSVPLFTIVDGNGVPFHTYDKDSAGGFGMLFLSLIRLVTPKGGDCVVFILLQVTNFLPLLQVTFSPHIEVLSMY